LDPGGHEEGLEGYLSFSAQIKPIQKEVQSTLIIIVLSAFWNLKINDMFHDFLFSFPYMISG
jgi:hypothetical protein